MHSEIICLQETNWDDEIMGKCKKQLKGAIYANNGSKISCGVAILVKEGSVNNIKHIPSDKNGGCRDSQYESKSNRK